MTLGRFEAACLVIWLTLVLAAQATVLAQTDGPLSVLHLSLSGFAVAGLVIVWLPYRLVARRAKVALEEAIRAPLLRA